MIRDGKISSSEEFRRKGHQEGAEIVHIHITPTAILDKSSFTDGFQLLSALSLRAVHAGEHACCMSYHLCQNRKKKMSKIHALPRGLCVRDAESLCIVWCVAFFLFQL